MMRLVRRLYFLVAYNLYARRKLGKTDFITIYAFTLEVPPTVFHPALYFSSKLLAKYILSLDLQGRNVLDVGCGSGLLSLAAASRGAHVRSVDMNDAAVEATVRNAQRNALQPLISAQKSDLFEALEPDSKFDLILLNPPFYAGEPNNISDHAWRGGRDYEFIRKFVPQSKLHLEKQGAVILILTSDIDIDLIRNLFESEGFKLQDVFSKRILFETFHIFKAMHPLDSH